MQASDRGYVVWLLGARWHLTGTAPFALQVYSLHWNQVRRDCFLSGSWDDTVSLVAFRVLPLVAFRFSSPAETSARLQFAVFPSCLSGSWDDSARLSFSSCRVCSVPKTSLCLV